MSTQDYLAELEKVRKEQGELLKKLDVTATAITRSRVRLHARERGTEDIEHGKREQEHGELDAAEIQPLLEDKFRREESLLEKLGQKREAEKVSDDGPTADVGRKQEMQEVQKDELSEALGAVKLLKERSQDHRVDQTYTGKVLETAEREVERIQQQMRKGPSL